MYVSLCTKASDGEPDRKIIELRFIWDFFFLFVAKLGWLFSPLVPSIKRM